MSNNIKNLEGIINRALKEDIGSGDITSRIIITKDKKIKAVLLLKEKAVVCGLEVAREVFRAVDSSLRFQARSKDGSLEKTGRVIAGIEGNARSILKAERTALNFLSHLSGIATLTRRFVRAVKPYKARIYDTRKTIPGLRVLEKYAVSVGGGCNHRMGLYDGILIKDNHIAASCAMRGVSCVKKLVETAQAQAPKHVKVEVEVVKLEEFREALTLSPDIIMLDNMKIDDIKKAVFLNNRKSKTANRKPQIVTLIEVSGGVTLDNVREIARTGVDMISIGALTHSAKAVDVSLEVVRKLSS